jgi:hypothetical protein
VGKRSVEIGKAEQRAVAALYRTVGGDVYELGTTRSRGGRCVRCAAFVPNRDMTTRQTPGLPDLLVFLPPRGAEPAVQVWHEAKAGSGRLSPAQQKFRSWCQAAHVEHVTGGVDAAIAYLVDHGRLRADQVPHYRLPKGDR